ncbi:MAG TPA: polyphenol oxidase family protein [Bdellovibrionales bacterium]|nr:polyphenol oxidase family protein [Bdellovibrionales bacterium]
MLNSFNDHSLGHCFEDSEVTVFYGNSASARDAIALNFPDYNLSYVKQTHSNIAVFAPTENGREADAQITSQKKVALCIRTADCVPVMIHDYASQQVAGIHAGWRGVENGAIQAAGDLMRRRETDLRTARAWIGPHIRCESFEVGLDVAAKLEAALDRVRGFSGAQTCLLPHENPEKKRVNLSMIVRAQLLSLGISESRIFELSIDTVGSQSHDSYRRDRKTDNRQTSFIALK